MVWIKHLPVYTKTFNVCRHYRCRQYTSSLNQIPPIGSNSPGDESGPEKIEVIKPIKMAFSEYTSPEEVFNAPPLIIMHGLMGSRNNWKSLSKAIHARTKLKVITVDARNHGDSAHSPEVSYPHMAEDVRKLILDLNISQAALLGHSMGGRTMMTVALKYPELVSRLVVVDISPVAVSPSLHLMPRYFDAMDEVTLPAGLTASEARAAADKQLRSVVKDAGVRQFILTNLVPGEDGKFKWRLNLSGLARGFIDLARFPAADDQLVYSGPTLFVAGGSSDYIPVKSHGETRQMFPAARFETIDKAGHWVHAEKPNEFLEVVSSFLAPESSS